MTVYLASSAAELNNLLSKAVAGDKIELLPGSYGDVELVAVADLIEDRRLAAAKKYNVPKTYASGAELLEDPRIEAVVLAVPAADRIELGIEALKHGKHLLLQTVLGEVSEACVAGSGSASMVSCTV